MLAMEAVPTRVMHGEGARAVHEGTTMVMRTAVSLVLQSALRLCIHTTARSLLHASDHLPTLTPPDSTCRDPSPHPLGDMLTTLTMYQVRAGRPTAGMSTLLSLGC